VGARVGSAAGTGEELIGKGRAHQGRAGKGSARMHPLDEPRRATAIRACVFDLFGTLVPVSRLTDYYGTLASLSAALGIPEAAFRAEWDATYRERNDGRLATLEDNVRLICARLQVRAEDDEIIRGLVPFRELLRATLRPKPESEEVLREIAERGYPLGLISNCNPDVPAVFRAGPLARHFHVALFSSEVGAAKPDARIYAQMIARLQVEPAACLYVGDGHGREMAGASRAGMVTALLDNGQPDGYIFDRDESADHELRNLREVLPLLDALTVPAALAPPHAPSRPQGSATWSTPAGST